jgi:transcriptional regulator with XRE-family HTH domain
MSKLQSSGLTRPYQHEIDPIIYRLAAVIRGMRLTQTEVALRTGVSVSTVHRIMHGKRGTLLFRTVARVVIGLGAMHVPLLSKPKVRGHIASGRKSVEQEIKQ